MARRYQIFEFKEEIRIGRIVFLRAQIVTHPPNPFALIHYSIRGKEQTLGLRMDLDKRVFLDHIEGVDDREVALKVIEFLANHRLTKKPKANSRQR